MLVEFFIFLFFINLSSADECGKAKYGIGLSVGGEYSEPGQWPWLASLFYKGNYSCGSSVISKRFLLGAAHCVQPKGYSIPFFTSDFLSYLGRYDLNVKSDSNVIERNFSSITIHPDWNATSTNTKYDGDIALFRMKEEVQFSNFIQPICLPSKSSKIFDVTGTVAGYGKSESSPRHENRPKHIQIKSVTHEVCLFEEPTYATISSPKMFCAGMKGTNPCSGDSGGPFMVQVNNKWTINGIVSSAINKECIDNDFVLFTQVPLFVDWIKQAMEGVSSPSRGAIEDFPLMCNFKWIDDLKKYECNAHSFRVLQRDKKVSSILGAPSTEALDNLITIVINGGSDPSHNQVHYLPDFSALKNFKQLYITNAGLKELDRGKIELLTQLTLFNVYGNEIKELSENIFDDLVNLEVLAFVKNQIKILPKKLLWKLPKLKELWAWDNQIDAIPPRFFKNNLNIEKVWLQNNKIARVGIVLRSMTKLSILDLSNNVCINKRTTENFEDLQNEIDDNC